MVASAIKFVSRQPKENLSGIIEVDVTCKPCVVSPEFVNGKILCPDCRAELVDWDEPFHRFVNRLNCLDESLQIVAADEVVYGVLYGCNSCSEDANPGDHMYPSYDHEYCLLVLENEGCLTAGWYLLMYKSIDLDHKRIEV